MLNNNSNSGNNKSQGNNGNSGSKPDPKAFDVRNRIEQRVVDTLGKRK
ncbi:MAG: hypothetical protein JNL19_09585 [Burkholderiales bacterium]|nr:hypothetical protein [Burkholderiales bacterium]